MLTQDDVDRFATLSGDDNPIHVDPEFAARTPFGRTISHGMLLYGAICGALSRSFPGAQQIEQELAFPHPTYAGEEVTLRLAVTEIAPGGAAWIDTAVIKPDGSEGCRGKTLVRWPQG